MRVQVKALFPSLHYQATLVAGALSATCGQACGKWGSGELEKGFHTGLQRPSTGIVISGEEQCQVPHNIHGVASHPLTPPLLASCQSHLQGPGWKTGSQQAEGSFHAKLGAHALGSVPQGSHVNTHYGVSQFKLSCS